MSAVERFGDSHGSWPSCDEYRGAVGAIVTFVRVERNGGPHARITVWNRGGNAGVLTVEQKDAEQIAGRLLGRDLVVSQ